VSRSAPLAIAPAALVIPSVGRRLLGRDRRCLEREALLLPPFRQTRLTPQAPSSRVRRISRPRAFLRSCGSHTTTTLGRPLRRLRGYYVGLSNTRYKRA